MKGLKDCPQDCETECRMSEKGETRVGHAARERRTIVNVSNYQDSG